MTGVPGIRRSLASMQLLQLGWSAGVLTRNGAVGTSVPLNVGAAPLWLSCAIGLDIVQTTRPLHESANRPPKKPQKWPVFTSGPSMVSTKVSLVPALASRLTVGWTVSAKKG